MDSSDSNATSSMSTSSIAPSPSPSFHSHYISSRLRHYEAILPTPLNSTNPDSTVSTSHPLPDYVGQTRHSSNFLRRPIPPWDCGLSAPSSVPPPNPCDLAPSLPRPRGKAPSSPPLCVVSGGLHRDVLELVVTHTLVSSPSPPSSSSSAL
eukprot:CAMPEP_0182453650 /NCGR_PEP_ID=MMETSP1319-20130603/627_1 /TAXON_ID=172717 /ORGANISM="Bolidomonas pacifica, Strain RCC208" /LENGTH=150 /DNA_ID=CAMNT_0024651603 /DNA_START=156 /DNA_END=605 /DNA_ORIENTATION=+